MTSPIPSPLRLATRASTLALTQSRLIARALCALESTLCVEELHVVTQGDRIQDRSLQELGGKGLFVKEIEVALLEGRADIAVHSVKDLPAELEDDLMIGAFPERANPGDVLVSASGATLAELPAGAKVGTSSLRRKALLLEARPDLEIVPLRGNVDTRLRKVREGLVDATILAQAGLARLGLEQVATERLDPAWFLPAVGQGALGVECRRDADPVRSLVARLDEPVTRICVAAERAFMVAVEGSCRMPVAAFARRQGDELLVSAMLAEEDCSGMRRAERGIRWPADDEQAARLGRELGEELRAAAPGP